MDNRVYGLLGTRELTPRSRAVDLEALTRDLPEMAGLVSMPADATSQMGGKARLLNGLCIH
jgi:hypothetical protein